MPSTKAADEPVYSEADQAVITAFAGGDRTLRDQAIAIHRAVLEQVRESGHDPSRQSLRLPYGNVFFEFMREIDNPCPDLVLRNRYRSKLIEQNTKLAAAPSMRKR